MVEVAEYFNWALTFKHPIPPTCKPILNGLDMFLLLSSNVSSQFIFGNHFTYCDVLIALYCRMQLCCTQFCHIRLAKYHRSICKPSLMVSTCFFYYNHRMYQVSLSLAIILLIVMFWSLNIAGWNYVADSLPYETSLKPITWKPFLNGLDKFLLAS